MKTFFIGVLCSLFATLSLPAFAVKDARNFDRVLANLIEQGDHLASHYDPSDSIATSDGFSRLYFDQFESSGLEFRLAATNANLTARIELGFSSLIHTSIESGAKSDILNQWNNLRVHLQSINTSKLNSDTWIGSFTQSLLILLREGVEAILLITLLITLLTRSGHGDKIYLIWSGVFAAVLASVVLAWGLQALINNIGKTREMIEGVILLAAALLLCYVSFWLLSQKESRQWQQYLYKRIEQELERSNQLAVFLMAFVAVFREGAETILFYQALIIESQSYNQALWVGGLTAVCLLVGIYFSLNKLIRLIKLDYFFKVTAIMLFIMAVVFTGKGVMELQASSLIPITKLEGMIMVPALGVFPTLEALSAQLAIIFIFIGLYISVSKMKKWS